MAYAYANLNSSEAKDDVTRCLVWIGDQLVDTQKTGIMSRYFYNTAGAEAEETLYLRVAGMSGTILYKNFYKLEVPMRVHPSVATRYESIGWV